MDRPMSTTNNQKQAARQFVKGANDAAVLEAYGFPKDTTESEIVSELFKLYQKIVG